MVHSRCDPGLSTTLKSANGSAEYLGLIVLRRDILNRKIHFIFGFLLAVTSARSATAKNSASCLDCHIVPSQFGSSQLTVSRVGRLDDGKFISGVEGGILHKQGSQSSSGPGSARLLGIESRRVFTVMASLRPSRITRSQRTVSASTR
jgi:hypothetical protein